VREWAGMPRIVFTFCPLRDSSIKDDDLPGSDSLGVGAGEGGVKSYVRDGIPLREPISVNFFTSRSTYDTY
jgi:hypothetical protein